MYKCACCGSIKVYVESHVWENGRGWRNTTSSKKGYCLECDKDVKLNKCEK